MHRQHQIATLVYDYLFPHPRPEDPTSFSAHLSKNLVGEVRIETATFYGSLDTIEARYPGLNYSHSPHRKRLGRFPHHARLFDAFDALRLTEHEIATFCRWEGTLWARERFERDENIKVKDTTGMEIGEWVDNRKRQPAGIKVKTDIEVEIEEALPSSNEDDVVDRNMADIQESSDEEVVESVGYALNQRLMEAAALREQGVSATMDAEWEQYFKEAQEREQRRNSNNASPGTSSGNGGSIHTPTTTVPPIVPVSFSTSSSLTRTPMIPSPPAAR